MADSTQEMSTTNGPFASTTESAPHQFLRSLADANTIVITAYNILPTGEEAVSIETVYHRAEPR